MEMSKSSETYIRGILFHRFNQLNDIEFADLFGLLLAGVAYEDMARELKFYQGPI